LAALAEFQLKNIVALWYTLKIGKKEVLMKSKKFMKRLMLNKKTISDLNNQEMGKVYGGEPISIVHGPFTCYSLCPSAIYCCKDPN